MYSCLNDITTRIIPFVQQLNSVILLILLGILLKVENVVGRKNQLTLFDDSCILFQIIYKETHLTTALHHSLNHTCFGILSG